MPIKTIYKTLYEQKELSHHVLCIIIIMSCTRLLCCISETLLFSTYMMLFMARANPIVFVLRYRYRNTYVVLYLGI